MMSLTCNEHILDLCQVLNSLMHSNDTSDIKIIKSALDDAMKLAKLELVDADNVEEYLESVGWLNAAEEFIKIIYGNRDA